MINMSQQFEECAFKNENRGLLPQHENPHTQNYSLSLFSAGFLISDSDKNTESWQNAIIEFQQLPSEEITKNRLFPHWKILWEND